MDKDCVINKIEIKISGPVQCGKSAVMQSIKEFLESANYVVVLASTSKRLNPDDNLVDSAPHERPGIDKTVFVLVEANVREQQ